VNGARMHQAGARDRRPAAARRAQKQECTRNATIRDRVTADIPIVRRSSPQDFVEVSGIESFNDGSGQACRSALARVALPAQAIRRWARWRKNRDNFCKILMASSVRRWYTPFCCICSWYQASSCYMGISLAPGGGRGSGF
jgi:hypothetical protein